MKTNGCDDVMKGEADMMSRGMNEDEKMMMLGCKMWRISFSDKKLYIVAWLVD